MRTTLFILAFPSLAFAGGFAISEQDAAASGRSGTAIARSGSPSAVHFNPAAMTGISGVAATAGATAILPSASATNPSTQVSDSANPGVKTPPHAYAALGLGDWAFGLGFNAPFGGGLAWPTEWRGRYELTQMSLQVLSGHLGAAYKITDALSVGATASLYSASVTLDKNIDVVDHDATAQLGGGGFGIGAGLGAWYAATRDFRIGLIGKLPVPTTLTGRVHFENVPSTFNDTLQDQTIRSQLTLPGKIGFGAEYHLSAYRLFLDAEYTAWSSFESFAVDFEEPGTPDVNQARNWSNTVTARVGAERDFGLNVVRAGLVLDQAASPADTLSPSLPDSTRVGASVGYGRGFGDMHVDVAYQFVTFLPRQSEGQALPAAYSASAHLLALSLSYGAAN